MSMGARSHEGAPLGLRLPLLLLGFLSLLAGLAAGLGRLGWTWPHVSEGLAFLHGPLMVSGFFGTLIGLERAVALGRPWVYGGPALTGLGGLLLIMGTPPFIGAGMIAVGSAVFLAVSLAILRRQRELFNVTLVVGALSWLAGNLLWLGGRSVPEVVLWWALFLVFTIAGERLELSRVLRPTWRARALFIVALAVLLAAAFVNLWSSRLAWPLQGVGLIGLALWLARNDIARRTAKLMTGQPRFSAISLLSGYLWLALSGLSAIAQSLFDNPFAYDATLHALFLGFVFAMVFGHAPIILPAITRRPMSYRQSFYAHLALLHISLLLRITGDGTGWQEGRLYGGLLNVGTLLLFLVMTALAMFAGQRPAGT